MVKFSRMVGFTSTILVLMFWGIKLAYCSFITPSLVGQKIEQTGKPIHVNVGLIQTDVMVFDKQGHFIPDLRMDQFELRIDGKVQPIEFFEMVSAGSPHDEEVWKSENKAILSIESPATGTSKIERTLFFFIDDWHLSADSVMRSRTALSNVINTSLGPNDRVAIFAASGQLGSAPSLVSDKAALFAVLEKLNFKSAGVEDLEYPPMNETQAVLIEQNDQDVISYFARATAATNQDISAKATVGRDAGKASEIVRRRAASLAQTSAGIAERSLSALRNLLRSAEALPGRKVVFLLSDGFVLQPQRSDIVSRIGEVTTGAARAGIVIYTLDTRGLVAGLPDARTKRAPDTKGELAHSGANEVASVQDALNALAADTGGRFLKNTNALDTALITTLTEISRYYLVGWYIDPGKLKPGKYSTIKALIKGRSDLTVRVRQGLLDLSELVSRKQKGR